MALALLFVYVLIGATVVVSYNGFRNRAFLDGYKFEVDGILIHKEYFRLVTSGFLHGSWVHLLFNMIALYAFAEGLAQAGIFQFLSVYFGSLVGGNLFALLMHRQHGDYAAVGASGAVCGVIFACIAIFPGMGIYPFGLPVELPSWLYGLLFVGISLYGIKSRKDNIGHEAHLGGAVAGMVIALVFNPSALAVNYIPILIVTLPTLALIYIVLYKPHLLLIDTPFSGKRTKSYDIDHRYNGQKRGKQDELDSLLDKISRKGIQNLSEKEKKRLEELSR